MASYWPDFAGGKETSPNTFDFFSRTILYRGPAMKVTIEDVKFALARFAMLFPFHNEEHLIKTADIWLEHFHGMEASEFKAACLSVARRSLYGFRYRLIFTETPQGTAQNFMPVHCEHGCGSPTSFGYIYISNSAKPISF
ncbi:hypothetical protein [Paludibacterium denitrificans]|uniref:Uncharacterized protein n=1 Tax=Paludibacterium denitrificans TaxID=2675226 RepID=A0A844GAF5_9NEIS|nr:hypothetical protein [Paludibacterium denitrificans]MTD32609.1 hypothetical protein [Paludibacterium denitrificans]